jgi:iron complex outermembrane receptor protein
LPKSFYVYEQAYDVAGKPIDGVYIDRDMDGSITEKISIVFINPADVFYGVNTSFTYKNFDFGMN